MSLIIKIKKFIYFLFLFWIFCYCMLNVIFLFAPGEVFYNNKKLVKYYYSIGLYPKYENLILNFSGKCSEIFKYKKNSNRDLIIFSYKYEFKYKYRNIKNLVINILDSIKKSMPNVKIICFIPKNTKYSLILNILKKSNVETILFEKYKEMHIVNSRFFLSLEYLTKNKEKFDRILLCDLNDVFILNDIFSTFNESQFVINKECFDYDNKICDFFNATSPTKWLNEFYKENKTLYNYIHNLKSPILNAGVIMGGIEKIISFLTILTSNMDRNKTDKFGYDEMVLNQLYYYDKKFDDLKFIIEGCGQKICFKPESIVYDINSKIVRFIESECSPVIIHKHYPIFWNYGSLGNNNNININKYNKYNNNNKNFSNKNSDL